MWVVAVLNARGVARWTLRGRRNHPSVGLWVIGLGSLLVVLLALGLEAYGSAIHRYWLWGPTRLPWTWQGAPLSCVVGWGTVSVVCLMAATPALINKHPTPRGPSPLPVLIWVAVNLLFLISAVRHGLWEVAAVVAAGVTWPVASLLAWWGIQLRNARHGDRGMPARINSAQQP
jgi:hypothetical protein